MNYLRLSSTLRLRIQPFKPERDPFAGTLIRCQGFYLFIYLFFLSETIEEVFFPFSVL